MPFLPMEKLVLDSRFLMDQFAGPLAGSHGDSPMETGRLWPRPVWVFPGLMSTNLKIMGAFCQGVPLLSESGHLQDNLR